MNNLRSKLIRLAYHKPHLRPHLIPLISKTATTEAEAVLQLLQEPYSIENIEQAISLAETLEILPEVEDQVYQAIASENYDLFDHLFDNLRDTTRQRHQEAIKTYIEKEEGGLSISLNVQDVVTKVAFIAKEKSITQWVNKRYLDWISIGKLDALVDQRILSEEEVGSPEDLAKAFKNLGYTEVGGFIFRKFR